jgi:NADPH2:quinone reductase
MPSPGPSELLGKVTSSGVNPVDHKLRSGALAQFMPRDLPAEFGSEVSGVVEEVGQDVQGFAVGDEVFGSPAPTHGGYSEYTVLTASATAKKPTYVSFDDAVTLTVAAVTAYDAVTQLGLAEGQTLLINGVGGGVGVAAVQIARDLGIAVIGTASEGERPLAQMLGATFVPYGDGVEQRVRELMPDGVDGVLDLVGGSALSAVAALAKIVSAADPMTVSQLGGAPVQRDGTAVVLGKVASMVANGKLDPHVSDVVASDDVAQAIASVEGGHPVGKVVVKVS